MSNRKIHVYSEEEKKFLLSVIPGNTSEEIVAEYNKRFSEPITKERLKAFKNNNKICSLPPGKYRNPKPIGHEYIKDGYVFVKTEETPRGGQWNYKQKHRVLWEAENGPVPAGHILMFLDGDRQNCDLGNLELVTREELGIMIKMNLRSEFAEITKTGILIARVISAMEKKRRNGRSQWKKRKR